MQYISCGQVRREKADRLVVLVDRLAELPLTVERIRLLDVAFGVLGATKRREPESEEQQAGGV